MNRTRRRGGLVAAAAAGLLVAAPAFGAAGPGTDTTTLVTVNSASTNAADAGSKWVEQAYDCTGGDFTTPNQRFQSGPGTPVLGAGSHVLSVNSNSNDTELFRTAQFDGTYASDITHLVYSTYEGPSSNGNVQEPAYLRLSFDTNGDTAPDTSLFYEPSVNHTVTDGAWQSWDTTASGEQWAIDGDATNLTTLHSFATNNPDARLENTANGSAGGVSMVAGCAGDNQVNDDFAVDGFGIETSAAHSGAPGPTSLLVDFDPSGTATNTSNVVVTPDSPDGWNAASYDSTTGNDTTPDQSMVTGPGTPPAGAGSREIRENGSDVVELWRSPELDGVNVGDIRQLDYWTYEQPDQSNANQQQPAYLRLSIDTNGDGVGDSTLYYEPAFNHPADIQAGTWQQWHTGQELWSTDGSEDPGSLTTLAGFASQHPQATVRIPANAAGNGGLSVVVGGAGASQQNADFYVDDLRVDYFRGATAETDRTFDFDPKPSNKAGSGSGGGGGGSPSPSPSSQTPPSAPTIHAPKQVVSAQTVGLHGTAVAGDTVKLFERTSGQSSFTQVASTTANGNGGYAFQRHVSKQTWWVARDVRNNGHADSSTVTTHVQVEVQLSLSSKHTGRLHMHVTTDPNAGHQAVHFYRVRKDGTHKLIASTSTGSRGNARATVDAHSRKHYTIYATVTAPTGDDPGRSTPETIRVR